MDPGLAHSHAGNRKMWPLTAEGLQGLSAIALLVATISGAIAVGAGFLSTIAANRASDLVQADADSRIAEAELKGREALVHAADANAGAAKANATAAAANERAAAAEERTERLRKDNLSLERIITPRHWLGPAARGSPTLDGLVDLGDKWSAVGAYRGTPAMIGAVPDFEAQRLADEIEEGLKGLGWSVTRSQIAASIFEGVEIWTRPKPPGATADSQDPASRAWFAADALAASFSAERITGERLSDHLHHDKLQRLYPANDIRHSLAAGAVVILIGPKPATLELWQRDDDRVRAKSPKDGGHPHP